MLQLPASLYCSGWNFHVLCDGPLTTFISVRDTWKNVSLRIIAIKYINNKFLTCSISRHDAVMFEAMRKVQKYSQKLNPIKKILQLYDLTRFCASFFQNIRYRSSSKLRNEATPSQNVAPKIFKTPLVQYNEILYGYQPFTDKIEQTLNYVRLP